MDFRVERTYRLLCDALEDLMREKPFGDITVSELCEQAMVRRTTFYDHFTDKSDFMRFYVRRLRDEISSSVMLDSADISLSDYCSQMTSLFIHELKERPDAIRYLKLSGELPYLAALISQEIAKHVESIAASQFERNNGSGNLCLDATVFANFYASGLLGLMTWWLESEDPPTEKQLATAFSRVVGTMVDALD